MEGKARDHQRRPTTDLFGTARPLDGNIEPVLDTNGHPLIPPFGLLQDARPDSAKRRNYSDNRPPR